MKPSTISFTYLKDAAPAFGVMNAAPGCFLTRTSGRVLCNQRLLIPISASLGPLQVVEGFFVSHKDPALAYFIGRFALN